MHRVLCHDGNELTISVTVLALETETTARKALEACWIAARDPQINRKEERMAVTRDLAPFLDLCEFRDDGEVRKEEGLLIVRIL